MSIHIDPCAELETIVVKTRSSVYELVVLRDDRGRCCCAAADISRSSGVSCSSVRLQRAVRSNHAQSTSVFA